MSNRQPLLELGHRLGDPVRQLALGAEGNISMRIETDIMSIKASGCALASMTSADLLDVRISTLLKLLSHKPDDELTQTVYESSKIDPTDRVPSVEAILHAVLYDTTPAQVIAHTHPITVNALGCSRQSELLVGGLLFPDAIVMMGRRQLLIPYTDPGVPLALAVRSGVEAFMADEGFAPKVIYLANHGLFVLAGSPTEALQVTEMAEKNAKILLGTLAAGGPNFLTFDNVQRIDKRPDELYRRGKLTAD
jgi:rhamnose utilization protein RhaD (predicted bifunctional aldolase and dehydrogenase)